MRNKKQAIITAIAFTIISFLLLYFSITLLLNHSVVLQKFIAYTVFSLIIGLVVGFFISFNAKIGFGIFLASYILAFASMILTFFSESNGWQKLAGLLQMLMILGTGTFAAAIVEIVRYFTKNKSQEN